MKYLFILQIIDDPTFSSFEDLFNAYSEGQQRELAAAN